MVASDGTFRRSSSVTVPSQCVHRGVFALGGGLKGADLSATVADDEVRVAGGARGVHEGRRGKLPAAGVRARRRGLELLVLFESSLEWVNGLRRVGVGSVERGSLGGVLIHQRALGIADPERLDLALLATRAGSRVEDANVLARAYRD